MANHTHELKFWHKHTHKHGGSEHTTGHYHLFAKTHDHGDHKKVHSHQERGEFHPGADMKEHHAKTDHDLGKKS